MATRPAVEIVGRHEEVTVVREFLDARRPIRTALLIQGEPGIGKTTLWRSGVQHAEAAGYRVLSASPTESETQLPFTALGDLLAEHVAEILDDLPTPQRRALEVALLLAEPRDVPLDRRATGVALLGALRVLAARSPVLVAVDDVQWLDAASGNALEFAIRRLGDLPVGLLLAQRMALDDHALPLALDRALDSPSLKRIALGALSLGATGAMLRHALGISFRRPTLQRIHDTAGGNPFYALELGRALLAGRGGEAHRDLALPGSLRDLVRGRIAALPAETLEALLVIAALSEPTQALAEQALGSDVEELLRPALETRVLEHGWGRMLFTHPLLRTAVYSEVSPAMRRDVHMRLAGLDLPLEERARHVALSADAPDAAAAALLEEAAQVARGRGAAETAADLSEHAVRLTSGEAAEVLHRRVVLTGQCFWSAGDYDRGREFLETAVATAPTRLLEASALLLLARNPRNLAESRQLLEEALEAAAESPSLQSDILVILAQYAHYTGDLQLALSQAESAVSLAAQVGDATKEGLALATRSLFIGYAGGGFDLDALERAASLEAATHARPVSEGAAYLYALALSWTDRLDEARRVLEDLVARGYDAGDVTRAGALDALAHTELRAGDVARAEKHLDEASELAEQFGLERLRVAVAGSRAAVDAALGREGAARSACEWLREASGPTSDRLAQVRADMVLGPLELSLGNLVDAHRHVEHGLEILAAFGIRDPGISPLAPFGVETALATGDLDRAEELTRSLEELVAANPRPRVVVYALRCRGLVQAARGDLEGALASIERAVDEQEALPVPFECARTLFALGNVQRRALRRGDARKSLGAAAAIFEQLGYRFWLDRTRDELGRIGGRAASTGGLTPTEQRIAGHVADGLSTKQIAAALFISAKTVEGHLSSIYAKLGIHSRTELAHRLRAGSAR
jgi:DNA-binding CsgD family transcriptional regulator